MRAPRPHRGERAAQEARARLGLGETEPVADLLGVVERTVGVPVLIDRFDAADIAGVLLRRGDGDAFIGINADHHPVKQRFTLAHELGHVTLDHAPRVELADDLFGAPATDPQEVEANYFAAELLAPRAAVRAWVADALPSDAVDAAGVARLAVTFGIALPTACFRLERAGAIDRPRKEQLLAELRQRGRALVAGVKRHRLRDRLETLWRDRAYPRVPELTARYAELALEQGLIEQAEYDRIARPLTGADVPDWFA